MENKFAGLPGIETIQPERLIKYRISKDKFAAEVLLPGFAYTDFDQKIGGEYDHWSITFNYNMSITYAVMSPEITVR